MTTIAGLVHSGDLSRFMTSGGCAAKVDSVTLEGILGGLASSGPVDAVVGLESRDDAAVVACPA